jgi:hypothetical protein
MAHLQQGAQNMLDELEWWAAALQAARNAGAIGTEKKTDEA